MKFDIGVWWHWLFVAAATLGSAYNACRVFFSAYDASHSPLFPPVFRFFYELAGSFAGWMALWYLLPLTFTCSAGACTFDPTLRGLLLLVIGALGVFGRLPDAIRFLASGAGRLVSGRA
jgi:hypothetical protein